MPTRFWEMAAGGLVLVAMKQRQNLAFQFKKVPSALVLAAILVLMLLPLTAAVPATIATVVLSAMMMASLEQGKGLGKVLSHKRVVWFGLISHSLYLWHWGVLSISRWTIGIHWWSVPFQLALIVLLAAISYRYIEKPFRTMSWGATPLATLGRSWLGVAGFVAAYLGIAKYIAPLFYIGPDPAGLQRDSISGVYIPCNYYRDRVSFEPETALQKCTYPAVVDKVGNSHVFYLGDSHAGQLGGLITRMREVPGLTQSVFYVGGAMIPPLNIEFYSKNDREWKRKDLKTQNAILGYVLSHAKQGDVLVLANGDFLLTDLWRNYRSDMKPVQKGERSDAIFYNRRLNSWKSSLEDLSKEVQHRGLHLVLIAPRPFFKTPVDAQGFALDYSTIHCGIMPELKRECQLRANRAALLEGLSQIRDYQDQLSNNYHAVKVYDPFPVLCPPAQTDCTTVVSGQLAYYDNHHLNGYGSGLLYEDFRKFLATNNLIRI